MYLYGRKENLLYRTLMDPVYEAKLRVTVRIQYLGNIDKPFLAITSRPTKIRSDDTC